MQVRDQHRVDVVRHLRRRAVAAQMSDPSAQDRVREEAHATVLDQHGRVADIRDARRQAARLSAADGRARITPLG
jgi:hypothetical protein